MRSPIIGSAVLVTLAVSGLASPARASSPWTPYRTQEVTVSAARSTCDFDVTITPLVDEEEYRTTSTYADGSPRTQTYRGTLVERYTNDRTGVFVDRDLSATGVFTFAPDGSPVSLVSRHGSFGATMPAGSTPDTGLFVLGGKDTGVFFNADGTRTYVLGKRGTAENVCDALG